MLMGHYDNEATMVIPGLVWRLTLWALGADYALLQDIEPRLAAIDTF